MLTKWPWRVFRNLMFCNSTTRMNIFTFYWNCFVSLLVKSLLWPGASQWRIYYHRMWGQLSTTSSNLLKQPNGELLVAVNHNQLRIMASKAVDPIDWSHPPPSWAVPFERLVHSINQCSLSGTRTCNRSMRGNHLAYAATQGMTLRCPRCSKLLKVAIT